MRYWYQFPVLMLAVFMLWGCASVKQLTQSANAAFDKGDNQAAIGFYRKALEQAPRDSWLWNQLGRAHNNLRNYEEAVKAYSKAVEIKPDDAAVWTNLGLLHHREKRYAEAVNAYTKALRIEPTAVRWNYAGNSRYDQKHYAEAVKAYTNALAIEPADKSTLYWRGWAHYRMGQYNKAIVDFDRVVQSREYGKDALSGRAWAYYRKGMYVEARQDFTAVLRIDTTNAGSSRGRGWSWYYSGNFKAAIKDFTAAIEHTKPDDKNNLRSSLHGKALAYLGVGDSETALYLMEKAHATAPLGEWSRIVFYYLSGDRQKAWQLRGGEGMIGAEVKDYKKEQTSGAEVVGLDKGSPAAEAGFLEGDVIVAVHGTRVSGANDTIRAVAARQPGSITEIVVLRENREKKLPVRIGSAAQAVLSDRLAAPLVRQKGMASMGSEIPAGGGMPTTGSVRKIPEGAAADEFF
jgi:tetratricopeptide (TPR) repeat protein